MLPRHCLWIVLVLFVNIPKPFRVGAVSWGLTRAAALEIGKPETVCRRISDLPKFVMGEPTDAP
jgi:hypothetical protein